MAPRFVGTAALTPSSLLTSSATMTASTAPADLTAVYSGDSNFNVSRSPAAVQTGTGSVIVSVTSSANPSVFAQPVTVRIEVARATVGAPVPTGTVDASLLGLFSLGSVTLDAAGQGSLAVPRISASGIPWGFAAGSNSVTLTYGGDANYASAQTNFTQSVNKADTVIAASTAGLAVNATVSVNDPRMTPLGFALPGGAAGQRQSHRHGTVLAVRYGDRHEHIKRDRAYAIHRAPI